MGGCQGEVMVSWADCLLPSAQETKLTIKFPKLRWRVCSIWEMFLSWSLIDSTMAHLRNNAWSPRGISRFYKVLLSLVTNRIPRSNSSGN